MLRGTNIVVLDLETAHSAHDCRHCSTHKRAWNNISCLAEDGHVTIGWDDHAALGLSIGCLYRYDTDRYEFFDVYTAQTMMDGLLATKPLLVSFNGIQFDAHVLAALYPDPVTPDGEPASDFPADWSSLWYQSYDILDQIWRQDPERKYEPGLNSLGAISVANSYGAKEMDGAQAPRLWREGRHAEVMNYCMSDVWKTARLFEQIVATGQILRGDGQVLRLPTMMPQLIALNEQRGI